MLQLSKEREVLFGDLLALFAEAAWEEYTKPKQQPEKAAGQTVKPVPIQPAEQTKPNLSPEEKRAKKRAYQNEYYAKHKEKY